MASNVVVVLVVFGERRRQVSYCLTENLLTAAKKAFSDVLDENGAFYLQAKNERWNQLVDVTDVECIKDGSIVHLFEEPAASSKASDQARQLCKRVGESQKLATLFGGSRKRSFDPKSECVVASQQAKKKATNQRMKPKIITIVLLDRKPHTVPKGHLRKKLKDAGRIVKLQLKRCMTACEVRDIIVDGFRDFSYIQSAQFLRCGKDNIMLLNEDQDLNGDSVIELAGQGSLYMVQKKVEVSRLVVMFAFSTGHWSIASSLTRFLHLSKSRLMFCLGCKTIFDSLLFYSILKPCYLRLTKYLLHLRIVPRG